MKMTYEKFVEALKEMIRALKRNASIDTPVRSTVAMLFAIALAILLYQAARPVRVNAQTYVAPGFQYPLAPYTYTPTNLSTTVVTNSSGSFLFNVLAATSYTNLQANTNNDQFLVRPGYGVAVAFFITNASGDAGKTISVYLDGSVDTANFDIHTNWTISAVLAGTSNWYTWSLPWNTNLDGYAAIQAYAATNSGAAPIGLGVVFSRPAPWKNTPTGL